MPKTRLKAAKDFIHGVLMRDPEVMSECRRIAMRVGRASPDIEILDELSSSEGIKRLHRRYDFWLVELVDIIKEIARHPNGDMRND